MNDELLNRIYHLPEELREHIYKYVTCQRLEVKRRQVSVCDIQLKLAVIKYKALWKSFEQQTHDLAGTLMTGPLGHCTQLNFRGDFDLDFYCRDQHSTIRLRAIGQFHIRLK